MTADATETGRKPTRTSGPKPSRKNDPEGTRQDILEVATEEFASLGFSGGRVDAIAARTRTTKRMIYYYFGGKEELYLAVLEKVYGDIRAIENKLNLQDLDPEAAIRALTDFTFDYQEQHEDFIRLVSIENIHRAEHMKQSKAIRNLNVTVIDTIARILERGRADGVFKADVQPIDLHLMISAFCFFRVSNRHTFNLIFHQDLTADDTRARHKRMIADAIVSLLKAEPASWSGTMNGPPGGSAA
ncbi:TetR/AcrR family transcriptional regulator [Azospirillum sp. TSO35-2]|uniref:TetR/AcrR family transcriptional regulator n=1 Tax=Azospirillum sp. TSO35-2 TaxID=716796 RepID=UPI000D61DA2D|nr:TetR/AcrR family transcriptional regulator [Azospirillum sp. TSO35-2]PWC39566.1 TetR family transcriptional regulator [Azospirillum sp. TSO35-2]